MIQLSPEQLYQLITQDQVKRITWFEGFVSNPKDHRVHFRHFKSEDNGAVLNHAKELLSQFSGLFTVAMNPRHDGGSLPDTVVRVLSTVQPTAMNGAQQGAGSMNSYQEVYDKVLKDLHQDLKVKQLEHERDMYKLQLNGMQSSGDKLAYVGMKMLEHYANKKTGVKTGAMQGIEIDTTRKIEIKDQEQLTKAFNIILFVLGEEAVCKVAAKLQEDPSKGEMIKTFL